jgi:hypothetical protein
VNSKFAETISVTDFGALCNGTTDDTAAIQAAINASSNKSLYLPGFCKVIGTGSSVLLQQAPITWIGADQLSSGLLVDSTVPNSRDILLIQPPGGSGNTGGYTFRNMSIVFNTGTPGRDAIRFDTTLSTTVEMSEVLLDHVQINYNGVGGYAIHLNNSPTNANGGTYHFTVQGSSLISGGIRLDNAGDSIRIKDSILTGKNAAISGTQIAGAGNIILDGNNVSNAGGAVSLSCAIAPRIINNELEQQVTSTEVNNAIVDMIADVCTIDNPVVENNQIQANTGTGSPALVRFGVNVSNPLLQGNRMATPTGYTGVNNASASLVCGPNSWHTGTPNINNFSGGAVVNNYGGC